MRQITTFLIAVVLCGCESLSKKDLQFSYIFDNCETSEHIRVSGTNMSIVPPKDFRYWEAKQVFHSLGKDSCMILLMENHGMNYYEAITHFRADEEKAYRAVISETHHIVNGFPATILFIQHDTKYEGYHIVFGDSTFVAYIMTAEPGKAHKLKKEIFNSLKTIYYDRNKEDTPDVNNNVRTAI